MSTLNSAKTPTLEPTLSLDFNPAPRGGLAGFAERALKQALLDGSLRPGERLITRELADRFGTSPTPVREALLRLTSAGILDIARSQAFQVPTLTAERYVEIADIRRQVEGLASARATSRISDGEIAALRAINRRLQTAKRTSDVPVALAANWAFRQGLYEAAGMPVLLDIIERLWLQIGPTLNLLYPQTASADDQPHTYALILAALERRDADAVQAAVERAIVAGTEIITARLRSPEAQRAIRLTAVP